MKISYNWLCEFLSQPVEAGEAAELLTSTGLETEGISVWESHRGGLQGVVTGEVITCIKHPDADKLSVCQVNIGRAELLNIVCGAPNVKAGQKVMVACVGAELFFHGKDEGLVIRKAKIRGVASEGMICAEDELGIGTSHDGIMVLPDDTEVGIPASVFFHATSDQVLEIGLTPNRTDAVSHIGVARDLVACKAFRFNADLNLNIPEIQHTEVKASLPVSIRINDDHACRRYTGITLAGVKVGPSPLWLKRRLEAIGAKPINNVVDVTNYVLHETGHPLHAFDYNTLADQTIVVQTLPEGTTFKTLDGIERTLSEQDLMICDAEKPLCIAGVYGGLGSGVTENTTDVFLESAWFEPVSIRRTARRHGLNTDASFRFERGADPNITTYALWRAVNMICELTGAVVASDLLDAGVYTTTPWECHVMVSMSAINRVAGQSITYDEVNKILSLLGFKVLNSHDPEAIRVAVPGYRADVTREIDVIEEILRIYGFDQIDIPESIPVAFPVATGKRTRELRDQLNGWLIHQGFNEVWNNSLSSSAHTGATNLAGEQLTPVKILNPLSQDLDIMRTSMLYGMLENARHNINRKITDFRLFEHGHVYALSTAASGTSAVTDRYHEMPLLALLITGNTSRESWYQNSTPSGVFDLKGALDQLLNLAGFRLSDLKVEGCNTNPLLTDCVCVNVQNKTIVRFGMVSGSLSKDFGVKQEIWYAEICWKTLSEQFEAKHTIATPLPKFPDVRRDLSLVLDQNTTFADIKHSISQSGSGLIHHVNLFDVYEGEHLPEGKKSYAVAITLRDLSKTLTDLEIDEVMKRIIQQLGAELGAVLR